MPQLGNITSNSSIVSHSENSSNIPTNIPTIGKESEKSKNEPNNHSSVSSFFAKETGPVSLKEIKAINRPVAEFVSPNILDLLRKEQAWVNVAKEDHPIQGCIMEKEGEKDGVVKFFQDDGFIHFHFDPNDILTSIEFRISSPDIKSKIPPPGGLIKNLIAFGVVNKSVLELPITTKLPE